MSESSPSEGEATADRALGAKAARGAAVSLAGSAARTLVQILGVVVLARLLSPTDYGLIAMVSVVIGIADIFRTFGLYTVAVRAPDLSQAQRSNLFWMNTGIGVALCALIFAGAPLIALLYGHPALVPVAQALAFTFVLSGASTQFRVALARDLAFGKMALADTLAPAVALIAGVAAAVGGWGTRALITQQLVQYATLLLLLVWFSRWRPGWYRRDTPMRQMWSLGWGLVTTQLINYVANNTDQFIIGLRFGTVAVGLYNRAFQLLMQPYNQVRVPVTDVAMPILAKVQGRDDDVTRFLQRAQTALGYTLGLGLTVVAAASVPVVDVFLGPRWSDIAPLFACLAIAAVFQLVDLVASWAFLVKGLVSPFRTFTLITAAVRILFILAGSWFGTLGVAVGYAAAPAVIWPFTFLFLGRVSGLRTRGLLSGATRVLLVNLVCGAAAHAAVRSMGALPSWGAIGLAVAVGLGGLALCSLVPTVRRDVRSCVDFARLIAPGTRGAAS